MSGWKQTFLSPVTEWGTVQKEALGTIRKEDGAKIYKYVTLQNSATVAGAVGDQVVYFAATGYQNNRVCTRAADGDAVPIGAGILTAAVAGVAATSYFGWIQIGGLATLSTNVAGAIAAGKLFIASTTNATFTVATAATDRGCGVSLDALKQALLDCPY